MSVFDRAAALAAGTVNRVYGETALLIPRQVSQYTARGADPERDEVSVVGVFEAGPEREEISGRRPPNQFRATSRAVTMEATFWLSAEVLAVLPWRPRSGDALQLSDRPGAPVYAISTADPTDLVDLALVLVIEDQP